MTKFIPEILEELNNDPSKLTDPKIKQITALSLVFSFAFHPKNKFLLPEGEPPYTPDSAPIGMSPGNLMMELRRLYIFTEQKDLKPVVREQHFVQMLESFHPSEARLLLAIKDQNLPSMYPNLTTNVLVNAGWLPEELRIPDTPVNKAKEVVTRIVNNVKKEINNDQPKRKPGRPFGSKTQNRKQKVD